MQSFQSPTGDPHRIPRVNHGFRCFNGEEPSPSGLSPREVGLGRRPRAELVIHTVIRLEVHGSSKWFSCVEIGCPNFQYLQENGLFFRRPIVLFGVSFLWTKEMAPQCVSKPGRCEEQGLHQASVPRGSGCSTRRPGESKPKPQACTKASCMASAGR